MIVETWNNLIYIFSITLKIIFYVQLTWLRNAKKCKTAYMSLHDMNIKFTQPPLIFTCTGNGIIKNFIFESLKQHYKHVSNSIKDRIKNFPKGARRWLGKGVIQDQGHFFIPPPLPSSRFTQAWLYTSSPVYNDLTV